MTATLENIRSYVGLPDTARQARFDAAPEFTAARYTPRRKVATSDPTPTPDRVTEARRAEIRERLGRGGNGMVGNTRPARVAREDNPDRPGRVDDGEPMRPQQERLAWVLLNRELRPINPAAADAGQRWFDAEKAKLTKMQASAWIDRIRAMIKAGPAAVVSAAPTTPAPEPKADTWAEWRALAAELVEAGGPTGARFAVETEAGSDNDLAFWWIVKHEGPMGTRYFLRQVIGGQGPVRVRMSPEAMISIARKIKAAGPLEALLRFGRELGSCGHCGRDLTNQVSRDFGMGPHCRKGRGI